MKARRRGWHTTGLAAWVAYCVFVVTGAAAVPFHPDESTYLFMSRDFDLLFLHGQPAAVTWRAADAPESVRGYRLLDPPLAHYLPGLGRWLLGFGDQAPSTDWTWSKSWQANEAAGALPEAGLLLAGRLPAAVLTALSPLLVYALGRRMDGPVTGALAAALYGFNSLILLHGRRAMSEGPLLFLLLLGMWLVLRRRPRPIFTGCSVAASVAAKLTGAILLPVAIVGALWRPPPLAEGPPPEDSNASPTFRRSRSWTTGLQWGQAAMLLLSFMVATALLAPSLWASPVAGLVAMAEARRRFTVQSRIELQELEPEQARMTPLTRALAIVYHGFYAPLAFADVANYSNDTRAAELEYGRSPLHTLFHTIALGTNLVTGTVLLSLALFGLGQAALVWRFGAAGVGFDERRALALIVFWSLMTVIGVSLAPTIWQRYYVPLVAPTSLWAAFGLVVITRQVSRLAARSAAAAKASP